MLVTKLMKIPEKSVCFAQLYIRCTSNHYDRIVVETFLFMNIYGRFVKETDEFAEQFSEEWLIRMISHAIDFVTQYWSNWSNEFIFYHNCSLLFNWSRKERERERERNKERERDYDESFLKL